jgi:hypothetical protein
MRWVHEGRFRDNDEGRKYGGVLHWRWVWKIWGDNLEMCTSGLLKDNDDDGRRQFDGFLLWRYIWLLDTITLLSR